MNTALTIAGSDSIGGAGIQADIKAMTVNGVYAMSAVTALTAQNTLGVTAISEVSPEFLKQQLDAVFSDIFPDAVKIGMISSPNLVHTIADRLRFYKAKNIVTDPIMISTSGARLISDTAKEALTAELFPLSTLVTPNIPEAEALSKIKITDEETMLAAAKYIGDTHGCAVLVKGGHSIENANDILYRAGHVTRFKGKRIENPNTHGTGCTLSSTVAAMLAKGFSLNTAIQKSKAYVCAALSAQLDLGHGSGPINHSFMLV